MMNSEDYAKLKLIWHEIGVAQVFAMMRNQATITIPQQVTAIILRLNPSTTLILRLKHLLLYRLRWPWLHNHQPPTPP